MTREYNKTLTKTLSSLKTHLSNRKTLKAEQIRHNVRLIEELCTQLSLKNQFSAQINANTGENINNGSGDINGSEMTDMKESIAMVRHKLDGIVTAVSDVRECILRLSQSLSALDDVISPYSPNSAPVSSSSDSNGGISSTSGNSNQRNGDGMMPSPPKSSPSPRTRTGNNNQSSRSVVNSSSDNSSQVRPEKEDRNVTPSKLPIPNRAYHHHEQQQISPISQPFNSFPNTSAGIGNNRILSPINVDSNDDGGSRMRRGASMKVSSFAEPSLKRYPFITYS